MFCFKRISSFFLKILPKSFFLIFLAFLFRAILRDRFCVFMMCISASLCASFSVVLIFFLSRFMWQIWKWSAKNFLINKVTQENVSKGKKWREFICMRQMNCAECEWNTVKHFHFPFFCRTLTRSSPPLLPPLLFTTSTYLLLPFFAFSIFFSFCSLNSICSCKPHILVRKKKTLEASDVEFLSLSFLAPLQSPTADTMLRREGVEQTHSCSICPLFRHDRKGPYRKCVFLSA